MDMTGPAANQEATDGAWAFVDSPLAGRRACQFVRVPVVSRQPNPSDSGNSAV